jgi:hypothetical protein
LLLRGRSLITQRTNGQMKKKQNENEARSIDRRQQGTTEQLL